MNHEQYEKHKRIKTILKTVGLLLIVIGLVLLVVGMVDFFSSAAQDKPQFPKKIWCMMVGLPLIFIGTSVTMFGFKKEVARYIKNETVPILNETASEVSPAISTVATAMKSGTSQKGIHCSKCGKYNEMGSKYCSSCGNLLLTYCPHCGEAVEAGTAYCNHCGEKLDI